MDTVTISKSARHRIAVLLRLYSAEQGNRLQQQQRGETYHERRCPYAKRGCPETKEYNRRIREAQDRVIDVAEALKELYREDGN